MPRCDALRGTNSGRLDDVADQQPSHASPSVTHHAEATAASLITPILWNDAILSFKVFRRLARLDEPAGGTHREYLHEAESALLVLRRERAPQHLARPEYIAGIVGGAARDIGNTVERREHFRHLDREAVLLRVAALERILGSLTQHGGRGHMPAGLAEHAVVEHDAGHILAARRRVNDFLKTFIHHVAVALQGEDDAVRVNTLEPGREARRAAVQCLHHLDIEPRRERGVAADAENTHRAIGKSHLLDHLHHCAHGGGLAASRAQLVRTRQDQRRCEVIDQRRRLDRGRVGADEALHAGTPWRLSAMNARIRAATFLGVNSGAMPKPELSKLSPRSSSHCRSRTARRTSSIIWPALSS